MEMFANPTLVGLLAFKVVRYCLLCNIVYKEYFTL